MWLVLRLVDWFWHVRFVGWFRYIQVLIDRFYLMVLLCLILDVRQCVFKCVVVFVFHIVVVLWNWVQFSV